MLLSASQPITYATTSVANIAADQLQAWRDAGIVILAGSLISTFAPSNLPTGSEVGHHVWSLLFGGGADAAAWPSWLQHDFLKLPFEVLTHCYPDVIGMKRAVQQGFRTANYNSVHKLLANELKTGNIQTILTTNYDMCLDSALQGTDRLATIWDQPSWEMSTRVSADGSKSLWKIHGSADVLDSLILSRQGEARMDEWKQSLLADLVRDKALMVIGYGGRDFEICPELAYSVHPRYVVWLDKNEQITPNAKRVLTEQRGTLVIGDLKQFLERVFLFDPAGLMRNPGAFDLPIDVGLIPEWRVRLLDWMACGSLVLASLIP